MRGRELPQLLWRVRAGVLHQVPHRLEELLEFGRRQNLEEAGRLVGRVPEGMHYPAGLEHVGSETGRDHALADPGTDLALDYVGILVDVAMGVRWNQAVRTDRVFDDRKCATGIAPEDLEEHTEPSHVERLAAVFARLNGQLHDFANRHLVSSLIVTEAVRTERVSRAIRCRAVDRQVSRRNQERLARWPHRWPHGDSDRRQGRSA